MLLEREAQLDGGDRDEDEHGGRRAAAVGDFIRRR